MKIALGGMVTAVSLVLMFLTGLFPFATFALPGLAGLLLVVIVLEMGCKQAIVAYVAVGILAVFITPDRDAALFYIAFLGYYPIVKSKFEQVNARVVEYALKIILFTVAVVACYFAALYLFGLNEIVPGVLWLIGGYLAGLVTFIIYDIAISRLITMYLYKIRPQYLKRIFK